MITKGYLLGDRYKIIDTLGEGGMSNVYLAQDIILQRKVAVKVLRLDLQHDPQTLHRFQREALATSELSHPNIVSVLDIGTDQGSPYMVMEYVSGPNLKEYLHAQYPLKLTKIIKIMDQILSAVALAHQHNVIHRDLKPENILMDATGNVKIADFGIAIALNQSLVTQTNSALGSVHYMSPEQTRGGLVTKQSDIYSLGIILYELITGKPPFDGDTAISIAMKHLNERIPSIRKNNSKIPQALENVVLKATAKDPRDRYDSALAMKASLDASLLPAHANDPIFVPAHDPNKDKTIAIPRGIGDDVTNTNKDVKSNSKVNKKTLMQNIKEHKWWWISSILAVVLITLILIFSLSRRHDVTIPNLQGYSEQEAVAALHSVNLSVGAITEAYSDNVKKGEVIKSTPAGGTTVTKGKSVDLVISKGKGLTVVPDVTGLDYDAARSKLEKLGFTVERRDQYSDDIDQGNVMMQSIDAGEKVKASDMTIVLTVSKGSKDNKSSSKKNTIKLRDLTGYSFKSVQDYAHDNGLNLRVQQQNSDSVDSGLIISQTPAPGTEISKGSTITVVVSKGKNASNSQTTINKKVDLTFDKNYDNDGQGNHVQIYISDADHNISNIYRDMYITKDTSFTIPFNLDNKPGEIRIVQNGKTISDESVTN